MDILRKTTVHQWINWKLLLPVIGMSTCSLAATDLVKAGRPAAEIIIPQNASGWTKQAARDFRYHIEKMSGVKLDVVTARKNSGLDAVYIGKNDGVELDSLERNGFVIRNVGRDLIISGKGEGPAQGVYHLLETKLGVRWLWPGELGEVIPRSNDLAVNDMNLRFKQPISSSRIHPSNAGQAGWASQKAWRDFNAADQQWLTRQGFSWDGKLRSQHSFGHPGWRYGAKYMKTHPEYFNMLPDGTRRPDPYHVSGAVEYCSTCPSSEGLLKQVLADWRDKRAKGYPFGPNLYLGENDANGSCCCPACLAADCSNDPNRLERAKAKFAKGDRNWMLELGNVTERYVQFYLKALAEAKKTDPNVKVIGWAAYGNYYDAPTHTKLSSDVVVAFVGKLMYPWTNEKVAALRNCWQGWHNSGAVMIFRPNFMLDGHNMPINFARKFHELYQYCLANGMIGTEFDSDIGQFAANGFNYYVMARMTRSPELSFETIKNEYCAAFGNAKNDISEYLDYWEKISDSQSTVDACNAVRYSPVGVEVGSWNYFYTKAPLVYTPEVMAKGFAILNRAKQHASGDEIAMKRVDFLHKGLKHAELTLEAQRFHETGDKYQLAAAVAKLDAFRAEIEPDFVSNMYHLNHWENICWDRPGLRFLLNAPGTPLTEGWKFQFDPKQTGESQGWFRDNFDCSKWASIGIDSGWEKQAVGIAWRQAHQGIDYDGVGWYRNTFTLKPEDTGKRIILTFGGVDEACTVWVNGLKVLERPFPYQGDQNSWMTPFSVDITKALRPDQPNTLAVKVIDTAGQGGIWRPVWLKSEAKENSNPNLVTSPGFESKKGWTPHIPKGKFTHGLDEKVFRSGQKSYFMNCTGLNPAGANLYERAWMRVFQPVKVTPGKSCFFRAWYRTLPGFKGQVRVWLLGKGLKCELVGSDTNGLWHELVSQECVIPAGTTNATIYLNMIGATGTVWFDDIELKYN